MTNLNAHWATENGMPQLTERQEEIRRLLVDEGLGARDAAEQLGITRNAIYQQITALKRKGVVPADYTPTGEVRLPSGVSEIPRMVQQEHIDTQSQMQVIAHLVEQNARLIAVIDRLTEQSNSAKKR